MSDILKSDENLAPSPQQVLKDAIMRHTGLDDSVLGPEIVSAILSETLDSLNLVSGVGAAAILGVTKQRVNQMKSMPEPILRIDGRVPTWAKSDVIEFNSKR